MTGSFDLLVIGGGSGGVRAARMAAQAGARVVLVEGAPLGGTCVNLGCIPKKLYAYAAEYASHFEQARGFGWWVDGATFNWHALRTARAAEIARLNGVYERMLLAAGVHIVRGWASFEDPHSVRVASAEGEQVLHASNILVATGSEAQVPAYPGQEHALVSDAMFDLPQLPRRLAVVGGGYIACEFASIFRGFGCEVTQLVRAGGVLRGFDEDVREVLAREMRAQGVDQRFGVQVASIERARGELQLRLADGALVTADAVLSATGRKPRTASLRLERAGLKATPNGALEVDDVMRTSVPHIFAVGDVTDRMQLTPVALGEAMVVVDTLFGQGRRRMSYEYVPTAVFTHPNVATVGYSEHEARSRFGDVRVFRSDFRALKHTLSGSAEKTMMKLLVDAATDRVVGLHVVGAEAGEIVQGFAVAMKAGATKELFDSTVGIHPTAAEEFVTMRQQVQA
ncbi:glutathione-disulfide reductase [Ramlibacter sp. G-1-2-2]|uniref:Glutathione-disulfide reductase n=1 Tax=Ramlibacter agri TaxID=2728837 RepID=A0A848HB57_9BURK|nr:glutathione-disulfide reductase [Ramlibacter agri]NML46739.1 glutathione-disulfide reductase [Ramlibacter agri]